MLRRQLQPVTICCRCLYRTWREGAAGQDEDRGIGWPEQVNQIRATKPNWNADFGGRSCVSKMSGEVECSLDSFDGEINQANWSRGKRRDLEEQCEDEGHNSAPEPDIHADLEGPSAPFELNQDDAQ